MDDLFLAVLDAEAKRRFPLHTEAMLTAGSIEEGLRASAREMAAYAREHPGWTGVYVEFWTHASRRPELRRREAEQLRALAGAQLARDRWSRDRLVAFQGERLRAVIAHAVAASRDLVVSRPVLMLG